MQEIGLSASLTLCSVINLQMTYKFVQLYAIFTVVGQQGPQACKGYKPCLAGENNFTSAMLQQCLKFVQNEPSVWNRPRSIY